MIRKYLEGRRKQFLLTPFCVVVVMSNNINRPAMCVCRHLSIETIDLYNENCVCEQGKRGQSIISLLDTFHVSPHLVLHTKFLLMYTWPRKKKTLKYIICIFRSIFSLLFFSVRQRKNSQRGKIHNAVDP